MVSDLVSLNLSESVLVLAYHLQRSLWLLGLPKDLSLRHLWGYGKTRFRPVQYNLDKQHKLPIPEHPPLIDRTI